MSVVIVVLNSEMSRKGDSVDADYRQPSPLDDTPFDSNGRTDSMRRLDGDYYQDDNEADIDSVVEALPIELSHTRVDTIGSGLATSEARLVNVQARLNAIKERLQKCEWK